MSAFEELAVQCERRGWRRGWRLGLDGVYPGGVLGDGFVINSLEVRARQSRELLTHVDCDPADLEAAAVAAASSLARQGLIA